MEPTPSQPRPRAARAPLPERLRAQRAAARARVAAWTRQPLTAEQRDLDALGWFNNLFF